MNNSVHFNTGLAGLWACWPHVGDAAELICSLKYTHDTIALTPIADAMAHLVNDRRRSLEQEPVLTWIPCTPRRRQNRGFDQAELLARATARRTKCRPRPLLRRQDAASQTTRNIRGRREGPQLMLRTSLSSSSKSVPHTVVVIDDVYTTGATMRSAADLLLTAGIHAVYGLVATAAPNEGLLWTSYGNSPLPASQNSRQVAAVLPRSVPAKICSGQNLLRHPHSAA